MVVTMMVALAILEPHSEKHCLRGLVLRRSKALRQDTNWLTVFD